MTEPAFLNDRLSRRTFIFGLRLWVVVGICVGAAIVIALFLVSLYFTLRRNGARSQRSSSGSSKKKKKKKTTKQGQERASPPTKAIVSHANPTIPSVSKEILEIRVDRPGGPDPSLDPDPDPDPHALALVPQPKEDSPTRLHMEIGKDHRISYPERPGSGGSGPGEQAAAAAPDVSHLGWGHWYTLRELQVSTEDFADENVIGEGGYGIVYRGVLEDGTRVAVKNLLNNRGQAEKEFKVEVEAIGRVRHKNLVRLLGYCVEGAHRMLVYEYVDNGNLEQWLHGDVGPCSPLTWEIRMNIIIGTAKGLTYLHEGLEPKVVHRDIKSSNILIDKQWNPKVSDFGLAKLLGSERSYVTTRVMGTFGYVAPEYASTGMLNERSDVYSFGILIMEIISGRNPVDYSRPSGEVNLVEWLKTMVTNRNPEGVLDPRLPEKPSSRALKRTLLVALRCVDPNAQKRPKMGHVVHMLEADEFPLRDDRRAGREHGRSHREILRDRLLDKCVTESGDSSGYESSVQGNMSMSRKQDPEEQ
ncbi:probable serine/threonine-protein kinase At1g01540 [Eucalyptus grandis]|uniref:probable serine/threonine-protein kinase At1g01540 n=1 Tax=Eucalyptus grandis TaxID=71139 RepID=UPI00192E9E4A|nr:probable serine/threonine-protein kinase At1g01540 [Eucalyptus grandis]